MSGLLTFDGGLPDQAMELLVEVLTDPWELCLDAPQEHYGSTRDGDKHCCTACWQIYHPDQDSEDQTDETISS